MENSPSLSNVVVLNLKKFDEDSFTKLVEQCVSNLWKSDTSFLLSRGGLELFQQHFGSIVLMRMVHKKAVSKVLVRVGFLAALARALPDMVLSPPLAMEGAKLLVTHSELDVESVTKFCLKVTGTGSSLFDGAVLKALNNAGVASGFVAGKGHNVLFWLLAHFGQDSGRDRVAVDAINRLEAHGLAVIEDARQLEFFSAAVSGLLPSSSDSLIPNVVSTLLRVAKSTPNLLPNARLVIVDILAILKKGGREDDQSAFFLLETLKRADSTFDPVAPGDWASKIFIKELKELNCLKRRPGSRTNWSTLSETSNCH